LAEWLYEEGIGENRAILVEDGEIIEAAIELPGEYRAGSVVAARLTKVLVTGRRGIASLDGRADAIVEPLPSGLTEGAAFSAEILREPIAERGRPKPARMRPTDAAPVRGPALIDRIGPHTVLRPVGQDRLEEAGWSELLDEALRGEIAFAGGALRMSVTPAMTLFDVDGSLPPPELARAGAAAAARTIRRLDITGSIGIDLPTLADRRERQAAASEVDRILPQPFERTAVNGFGFLQIVRRRRRPSIAEIVQGDPAAAAARAMLRRAQRVAGDVVIHAAPAVVGCLDARPQWLDTLRRQIGGSVSLQTDPDLAISAGHVQPGPSP
jgi:ribonuclease G